MHYEMISVQIFLIIIILYHELLKKSCIPSFHILLFAHSSEQVCPPQPSLSPCLPIYIPNGLAMRPSGKTHNLNTSVSSYSVPISLPRQLGQRDEEGGNFPLCLKLAGLTSQTLFYFVVTLKLSFVLSYFHFIEKGKRINRECWVCVELPHCRAAAVASPL